MEADKRLTRAIRNEIEPRLPALYDDVRYMAAQLASTAKTRPRRHSLPRAPTPSTNSSTAAGSRPTATASPISLYEHSARRLHDRDLYAWTQQQAAALRKLAAERWNGPLDLENLAEEIEDVGSDRRDAVVSQVRRLLVHLLKLEHSPSPQPRRQWLVTVNDARAETAQRWTEAIAREVVAGLDATYRRARRQAALELLDHGEAEAARALPIACPYTLDQLTDEDGCRSTGTGWPTMPSERDGPLTLYRPGSMG